jgi:hypothetical protein
MLRVLFWVVMVQIFFLKIAISFNKSDRSKRHAENLIGIYLQKLIATDTNLDAFLN